MAFLEKENAKGSKKETNADNRNKGTLDTEVNDKDGAESNIFAVILEAIGLFMFNYLRQIGLKARRIRIFCKKAFKRFYRKHLEHYVHVMQRRVLTIVRSLKKVIRFIFFKFYMFIKFFVDAKNVIKNGYTSKNGKNVAVKLWGAVCAFFKGVYNNRSIFVTWFNYALPIAAAFAFVILIRNVSSQQYAVSVTYNGEHLGYVENEAVFEQAQTKLQQRISYLDGDEAVDAIPQFLVALAEGEEVKSALQITDAILESSSEDIVKATGLNIDGVFYGAIENSDELETKLDSMLNQYKTDTPGEIVKFTKNVSLDSGLFLAENLTSADKLMELITREDEREAYYTIEAGDTPIIIAAKNDLTLDELTALNPGILESCVVGKQILINQSQPFLPVSQVRRETYQVEKPFSTEYTDSKSLYKGTTRVTQKGVAGLEEVTSDIEYVNGTKIGETEIERTVLKEAVVQKVTRGTGVYYDTAGSSKTDASASKFGFIYPVYGAYVSSPYGYRGREFHTGVDLACRYGTPIYAVAAGKVIMSSYNGTYGYMVKIDHGGGMQTWYAHASKLHVKAGTVVEQGQQIASVGTSGRSTGPHVHMEVRIYGATKNPMNYL